MRGRVSISAWPMTPVVKRILIVNAVVWLVTVLLYRFGDGVGFLRAMVPEDFSVSMAVEGGLFGAVPENVFGRWMMSHLGVVPHRIWPGLEIWQPFTYMWLHSTSDFSHILFNSLFLWMFGGTLERDWGSKAFFKFYLICGVGAGLIVFLAGAIFGTTVPTIGASGAIYGLVVAWAIAYPNRLIYIFGVIPMKGKFFALIPVGYALLDFIVGGSGVSHSAHLGGMIIGALLVTGYWRPSRAYNKLRYIYLKRKLKVLEGGQKNRKPPPDGGYWH